MNVVVSGCGPDPDPDIGTDAAGRLPVERVAAGRSVGREVVGVGVAEATAGR
ncbi:hypothetical protein [Halorubrum sp. DTA98]|uniref:hypothetical protein n=1 Tax=Halorubrum sp. DTA98 TaxID=3402163 RepID=UPI003AAF617B